MNEGIHISIPMPLLVCVEDVGWWSGTDGSDFNQPFRTGMPRDHVPADYSALAALGKGLDMRVLAGFVLCEWDKKNILKTLPSSTWMGKNWCNPGVGREQRELAASLIKKERQYIEFGLHGVGHEFWERGRMTRTEFHTPDGRMRQSQDVARHLSYFFKLMDQYGFDFTPRTFIPPALQHSFGNRENGFQKILNQFGIRCVILAFNRARQYAKPQTRTIAWENDVLLVERGEADVKWDAVACDPVFKFNRPVMALHWANILHPDPQKNIGVVEKWIRYVTEGASQKGMLLAKDTESAVTQYLHKVMSKITKDNEGVCIDVGWRDKVPGKIVGKSIFIKIDAPEGIHLKIHGTRELPTPRETEKKFLKLALPEQGRKIWIRPCN